MVDRRPRRSAELLTFPDSNALLRPAQGYWLAPRFMFASINVLRAQFFPSIFRPPVFDLRNQDLSVEFFHGAVSCAAPLVTCKPPICVRGACHHSAPPKARVDQGQSGTSQNRSRRRQAVGLSGQAPSIAPVLAASAACAFIWDAELKSPENMAPKSCSIRRGARFPGRPRATATFLATFAIFSRVLANEIFLDSAAPSPPSNP